MWPSLLLFLQLTQGWQEGECSAKRVETAEVVRDDFFPAPPRALLPFLREGTVPVRLQSRAGTWSHRPLDCMCQALL